MGNEVILTWSQGILQALVTDYSLKPNLSVLGPYYDVPGATSPYVTTAVGATTFYRLRCPCLTCSNCLTVECPTNVTIITCGVCTNVALTNYVGVIDNCCTNWHESFNYQTNFCFPAD